MKLQVLHTPWELRDDIYNGGAHFINVQDPGNPMAAGGYGAAGYTHDAQVVSV